MDFSNIDDSVWLLRAIRKGDIGKIQAFISDGINIFRVTENDRKTYLHQGVDTLAGSSSPEAVRYLIGLGLDVNARDRHNWTPLHYACRSTTPDTVMVLLKAGADVDIVNDEGDIPLLSFVHNNQPWRFDVIEEMLKRGADPNREHAKGGNSARKYVILSENPESDRLIALFDKYKPLDGPTPDYKAELDALRSDVPSPSKLPDYNVDPDHPSLGHFYFDAKYRRGCPSDDPLVGTLADALDRWVILNAVKGSFFGVVNEENDVLQFAYLDPETIVMEVPLAELSGGLQKEVTYQEAGEAIISVFEGKDPKKLPGLTFENWE
ncbi:ankyrin repeat domain-containing protein [Stratiformator vulcanicus]|uniref:Ankyrin repeats (3 copies) n=1 Tax=Stratiformator vulcanicus TaxID=2527980 RepID=A0A517QWP2_9PLAN|nr:ankyrin repeat domain-containing protein [Stratiformator vulcanicus]QDT36051.1 Ankyrin repeats (3 copies) [Stratiformator vulcanicus]